MNKNIELHSDKMASEEVTLPEVKKPSFNKPTFQIPVIKEIVSSKTKQKFNITDEMQPEEIEKLPQITLTLKHLKNFYDGLMKSINRYNDDISKEIKDNIISSTIKYIGNSTSGIESKINSIKTNLEEKIAEVRNEIPDIGEAPPRITGEENGLF
ncbi:MAG: hypothetical protein LBJ80_02370 [Rickettsiales bacterium]|jgi:hypothetical protein|nr:hypothetical protein [Rickettsiales bacterium]MDR1261246.1 hypothetical protein [Rickettsiales bacterium]